MAGHHPAALLPHGGPRESGRNVAHVKAGEAHRRGVEPRRCRFGVDAVHQHARCRTVNRRPESNRRRLIQITINCRPVPGRGGADGNALSRSQLSCQLDDACSTQRIRLAPIVLPEGAHRLPALRRRSDLLVAVERIEPSRARV